MKGPLILLIVGGALFVICVLVLIISLLLPVISDGKTSYEEALAGIIPGAVCSFLSFLLTIGGLLWLLLGSGGQGERYEDSPRRRRV